MTGEANIAQSAFACACSVLAPAGPGAWSEADSGAVIRRRVDHPRVIEVRGCRACAVGPKRGRASPAGLRRRSEKSVAECMVVRWDRAHRAATRTRAEARPVYARSHRAATAGAVAATAHADSRHRVIDLGPPCRCLGQERGPRAGLAMRTLCERSSPQHDRR